MDVQRLRQPRGVAPITPPCEASRVNVYFSDLPGRPLPKCRLYSAYVIRGKHLCARHAGIEALRILLEQSAEAAKPE
jgi:hypothetical protein